ncbi:DMT family transporter [Caldalkalibacillus salinus]|uniref:DMT family transporter n=1 Tax=Caldalkalibacillus salinus TaxID=2803787 RepID=UPI0019215772|nr:DMT family transporter [Caldalkalibacillus salinus]
MNTKALAMAIITVVIWGSTFAAIRASLQGGYEAGHLVLIRYLIASFFFALIALWPSIRFRFPAKKDFINMILLGWVGISLYHFGVTFGVQTIPAGTAGMLIGSAPIFTAIIAIVVLKERLSLLGWSGLAIGFVGIVCITLGSAEGSTFALSKGALLVLMAAVATSVFFVFQKPLLGRYHPIELTAYFTWAGTVPFFIFWPGLMTSIQNATFEAHLAALFAGIFPAGIAYVTWAMALSHGRASSVTSVMYLEPAVAIVVAWIWLNEWPAMLSVTGGVIALIGVLVVNGLGKKQKGQKNQGVSAVSKDAM